MKHFLFFFLFLLVTTTNCSAQVIKEGNTLSIETTKSAPIQTQYTYKIKGVEYPIYKGSKGSFYIIRISKKTGKEYKYYLPKEVQEELKKLI